MSDLVVNVHPMCKDIALADISKMVDGEVVAVTGSLRAFQLKRNMAGEDWATLVLAQEGETVTVLVFVRTFATVDKDRLSPETPVRVTGRVYRSDDGHTSDRGVERAKPRFRGVTGGRQTADR